MSGAGNGDCTRQQDKVISKVMGDPRRDHEAKLADSLGCSLDWLVGLGGPSPPPAPPRWLAELTPDLEALDKAG